jgi:guanine deaminase
VRAQWPQLQRDIAILEEVGLLTDRAVLAHCTHLHDCEARRMAERGTAIASCPYSNMLFARAVLPVNRFREMGVKIGLGTDIAGGHSASVVNSVRMTGLVSRIDGFQPPKDRTGDPVDLPVSESPDDKEVVNWKTAFYMGTRGGAIALGLGSVGTFEVGMKWDALEVDLTWDEDDVEIGIDGDGEDVEMKLERWICGHGGESDVRNVWVDGKLVLERD